MKHVTWRVLTQGIFNAKLGGSPVLEAAPVGEVLL